GLSAPEAVARLLGTLDHVACGTGCQGRLNMAAAVGAGPLPPATAKPPSPPTTRPPSPATTRARPATTSTVAPAPATTTTTRPPADLPQPIELAAPPTRLVAGRPRPVDESGSGRNPLVAAMAVILFVGAGTAQAVVAVTRRLSR
ncbi:MAG: hypothetical protein ACRDY5_08175, partial [Acidimicrobiales bacterium]